MVIPNRGTVIENRNTVFQKRGTFFEIENWLFILLCVLLSYSMLIICNIYICLFSLMFSSHIINSNLVFSLVTISIHSGHKETLTPTLIILNYTQVVREKFFFSIYYNLLVREPLILEKVSVYSYSYWLDIFCTTNNSAVLAREMFQNNEKNTIFNEHSVAWLTVFFKLKPFGLKYSIKEQFKDGQ